MDAMVLKTQQWLNRAYRGMTGYVEVSETGNTGWATINALTRALQIELGITQTSSNFGPTTTARFNSRFPTGVHQQEDDDESGNNINSIIQGALWCKGYSTGADDITSHFYGGTGRGIKNMKEDAGMINPDSTVTIDVMKALLSMTQFKLVLGGSAEIRKIQQRLNREYPGYINYDPCDGIYGREMSEDLIIVLQAIEGFTVSEATGNFGNGTKSRLPIIPYSGTTYTTNDIEEAILLIRAALYCNGFKTVSVTSKLWNNDLENTIREFQTEMCLPVTGICDLNTWMSLLLSKGNPDRSCNACDTVYGMRNDRLEVLASQGISTIGRYIVGGEGKEIDQEELNNIINRGFKFFPIYQVNGNPSLSHFTVEAAKENARIARIKAKYYKIPENSVIYFAVDYDVVNVEITDVIIPYFKTIKENIGCYKVGVYGTRNVCTRVMNTGYAETCFVSDMSTGYSGNMGFKMPENWNLDQFDEITLSATSGNFGIDKVTYSGRFPVVESLVSENGMRGFISEVEFSGQNSGNYRKFIGNKLKLYASAEKISDNIPDDAYVIIAIHAHPSVTNPIYPMVREVFVKFDGNIYTIADTVIEGKPYAEEYMKIESGAEYNLEYFVISNGQILNDARVKVHIEMETEN